MSEITPATARSTGATNLAAMVLEAARRHEGTALRHRRDGEWVDVSYEELGSAVREIGRGLIALGIEAGDKVAILSDTRPEWTLCDFGALCAGAVVVPIYQTASVEEVGHVLGDSAARLVFVETEEQRGRVEEARGDLDGLQTVVMLSGDGGDLTLEALREQGREADEGALHDRVENLGPDDLFTLIYTSGTTGAPKGCMLTHGNYRANLDMFEQIVEVAEDEEGIFYVFLPLAHTLTRMAQMLAIDVGATLAYWRRDKNLLLDDLKELRPTHLPAVPRIFEKIYQEAQAKADGRLKGAMLNKALELGRHVRDLEQAGEEPGPVLKREYALADSQLFSSVRDLFGGNLRLALTGAAPVAKEMLEFFHACGVPVLEGYGATETSAVAACNRPYEFRFGTVGRAVPDTEIRIADDTDADGRGEILIRGAHIFRGYYNNEEATSEVLEDDGWFHTEDLGTLDEDGFLTVSGRMKDIIVTSSGKNVSPTVIENKLTDHRYISQAVVFGDEKPYLVALLTLDPDERSRLADDAGVDDDAETMASSDEVHEKVQEAVDAANDDLAQVEQIKKFVILDRDLSQDEGEVTATMKVKRDVVHGNHAALFEGLYDDE